MRDLFQPFLGALSLLCLAAVADAAVYSAVSNIKEINTIQNQWTAGSNFDQKTEIALLNLYLRKLGQPLIPDPQFKARGIISDVVCLFGLHCGGKGTGGNKNEVPDSTKKPIHLHGHTHGAGKPGHGHDEGKPGHIHGHTHSAGKPGHSHDQGHGKPGHIHGHTNSGGKPGHRHDQDHGQTGHIHGHTHSAGKPGDSHDQGHGKPGHIHGHTHSGGKPGHSHDHGQGKPGDSHDKDHGKPSHIHGHTHSGGKPDHSHDHGQGKPGDSHDKDHGKPGHIHGHIHGAGKPGHDHHEHSTEKSDYTHETGTKPSQSKDDIVIVINPTRPHQDHTEKPVTLDNTKTTQKPVTLDNTKTTQKPVLSVDELTIEPVALDDESHKIDEPGLVDEEKSTPVTEPVFLDDKTTPVIEPAPPAASFPKPPDNEDHEEVVTQENEDWDDVEVPESFDAREKWPLCRQVISNIIEPPVPNCLTDWATSVVSAIQDRYCITNNANRDLSVAQVIECCDACTSCTDGQPRQAYKYFKTHGVPTGSQIKTVKSSPKQAGCRPYGNANYHGAWFSGDFKNISTTCQKACPNTRYNKPFERDLFRIQKYYMLGLGIQGTSSGSLNYEGEDIKREILHNGPVTATIGFYPDILYYKKGVYAPTPSAEKLGELAVKIIGWGREKDVDYWLATNVWGHDYGDSGLLKLEAFHPKLNAEAKVMGAKVVAMKPAKDRVVVDRVVYKCPENDASTKKPIEARKPKSTEPTTTKEPTTTEEPTTSTTTEPTTSTTTEPTTSTTAEPTTQSTAEPTTEEPTTEEETPGEPEPKALNSDDDCDC